jgi:hypothetical protein
MTNFNAAERQHVREAEKAAKLDLEERRQFVVAAMSHSAGRRYFCARLVACHVFSSSFSTNAMQMAFAEGERNQGLQLLNDLMQFCPDEYVQMMREYNARESSASLARELADDTGDLFTSNGAGGEERFNPERPFGDADARWANDE